CAHCVILADRRNVAAFLRRFRHGRRSRCLWLRQWAAASIESLDNCAIIDRRKELHLFAYRGLVEGVQSSPETLNAHRRDILAPYNPERAFFIDDAIFVSTSDNDGPNSTVIVFDRYAAGDQLIQAAWSEYQFTDPTVYKGASISDEEIDYLLARGRAMDDGKGAANLSRQLFARIGLAPEPAAHIARQAGRMTRRMRQLVRQDRIPRLVAGKGAPYRHMHAVC
ncbi:MAG TPA: hypothetical protein VD971_07335, partial [Phycisphaerales bacterium]|nr:hypothetical protein [Phycisphaerales bacterium]